MNFFRKDQTAFISLTVHDLQANAEELWNELNYVFEGFTPQTARLRLHECNNISLKSFSVIATLAEKLKSNGTTLDLEGPRPLLALLRKMHLATCFKSLSEVD